MMKTGQQDGSKKTLEIELQPLQDSQLHLPIHLKKSIKLLVLLVLLDLLGL
jgi:hypothetical protein